MIFQVQVRLSSVGKVRLRERGETDSQTIEDRIFVTEFPPQFVFFEGLSADWYSCENRSCIRFTHRGEARRAARVSEDRVASSSRRRFCLIA